ncbi:MAG: hypothetical protein M0P49_06185 [Bacilli bacterium]|nr:hypothetical protein [Bacilli bacterium]
MSKFINTEKKLTIDSLVTGFKDRMKNPYYSMQDKKPSIVTYYTHNFENSTLDNATKTEYSQLGDNSPIRYNKISDFFLYGIEKITVNLELGDYGLESNAIEGEAIVLPNTIIPIPGDYFEINYTGKDYLFKVMDSSPDTIDSGSNFYKITYKLDQTDNEKIDSLVVDSYNMVINNIGTKFNPIIKSNDYDFIVILEDILLRLKKYYKNLFYNDRVQTFTFTNNGCKFYDPYLIEFLIRNRLLEGDSEYIYIGHQITPHPTMFLDYDKTMFRNVELRSKDDIENRISSTATSITDPVSIFSSRKEDYYVIKYANNYNGLEFIQNFDPFLIDSIINNKTTDIGNTYYNIIVKYFNDIETFESNDVKFLEEIDYQSNLALFYCIPMMIYIIEYYIKNMLK